MRFARYGGRLAVAGLLLAVVAEAQHGHGDRHGSSPATVTQAGQSAFAALQEIVALLDADPNTDWSRVNLSALREHLVDMNELMLRADARTQPLADGLSVLVSGAGRAGAAARRMVPAHARELAKIPGWRAAAELTDDGVRLRVTSPNPAAAARIRGLGFFGLMTLGAHHQAHHQAIARGAPMH